MTNVTDYLAAANKPGAFQAVRWESTVKPAAASRDRVLTKVTDAVIRTGIDYANLSVNADTDTGELPWGEWSVFPYIIEHRGALYARLYVKDGSVRTRYFIDGVEATREAFDSHLTPSARKPRKSNGGTITVRLENVTLH
jgi:hypothetical protein